MFEKKKRRQDEIGRLVTGKIEQYGHKRSTHNPFGLSSTRRVVPQGRMSEKDYGR